MSRQIAALLAGFGTGFLQSQRSKAESERQSKRDKRDDEEHALRMEQNRIALEKMAREEKQETAVADGLARANDMRVGQGLRTKDGSAIDISEKGIDDRLDGGNLSPETQAAVAKTYADSVKEEDVKRWIPQMQGVDVPRTTNKADITRARADAFDKGGIKFADKALALNEQADKLDIDDLKMRIANGTPESLAKEYDEIFPDGLSLKFETGKDGKLYKFTEDANGNRSNYQTFADMDQFKQQLMTMVDKDPDSIQQYWKESRELERQNKKDSRDEKLSDIQIKKYEQDIAEGKIKLENLPQSIQLELEGKRANIRQSNASTASSIANTEKTREDIKQTRASGSNDKLPNAVREALWYKDASPDQKAAFDRMNDKSPKVTSDGQGGFMINKADGMYRMDRKGNLKKLTMPDGTESPAPKNRPPLSSFNKQQMQV